MGFFKHQISYKIKQKKSYLVLVLVCVIIIFIRYFTPFSNSLSWDVFAYYLYLPATFIYHDLGLTDREWVLILIQKYNLSDFFYQASPGFGNYWVMKCSMGVSLFYAPFFFIAHLYAGFFGYQQDGFTMPYQVFISFGVLIYAYIGLYFFYKILNGLFKDTVVSIVLLLVVFGTNYLFFISAAGLMSHNILFMLISMLIWYILKWDEHKKIKYAIFIGLLIGFITISRPNELTCLVFILMYILWRLNNIKLYWKQVFYVFPFILIVVFPQMLYWKITSGHWIYFSYQSPCEGFDFDEPHLIKFLFSYRKGWLLYSPLVLLMISGFPLLYKANKRLFFSIIAYFVISVYVISSWSCWWYAEGGYSQRAVLSLYVVLAIPLGFLVDWISNRRIFVKIVFAFICFCLVLLNLFQWWQYNHGILSGDRMTKAYYWKVFGKTMVNPGDRSLLSHETCINEDTVSIDFSKLPKKTYNVADKVILCPSFLNKTFVDTLFNNKNFYYVMDTMDEFSPNISVPYSSFKNKFYWVRVTCQVCFPDINLKKPPFLVITTIHKKENCKYYTYHIKPDTNKTNSWITISKLYLTPEPRSKKDKLSVMVWNPDKVKVYIRELRADLFEYQGY